MSCESALISLALACTCELHAGISLSTVCAHLCTRTGTVAAATAAESLCMLIQLALFQFGIQSPEGLGGFMTPELMPSLTKAGLGAGTKAAYSTAYC